MLGLALLIVCAIGGIGCMIMADSSFKLFGAVPIVLCLSLEAWAWISPVSFVSVIGTTGTLYLVALGVKFGAAALALWAFNKARMQKVERALLD